LGSDFFGRNLNWLDNRRHNQPFKEGLTPIAMSHSRVGGGFFCFREKNENIFRKSFAVNQK